MNLLSLSIITFTLPYDKPRYAIYLDVRTIFTSLQIRYVTDMITATQQFRKYTLHIIDITRRGTYFTMI